MSESPESKSGISHLVVDLDNTVWDWVKMFLPIFEAMSQKISEHTGVPVGEIEESMARVYREAATIEFSPLVQNLDVVQQSGLEDHQIRHLISEVRNVYRETRDQNLFLYDGVVEVFTELTENMGIQIHGISDAPRFYARSRMYHTGIGRFFTSLHTKPDPGKSQIRKFMATGTDVSRLKWDLPGGIIPNGKPDIDLAALYGITREEVEQSFAVLGDNIYKDAELARRNGCLPLFAKYGSTTSREEARLRELMIPSASELRHMDITDAMVDIIRDSRLRLVIVENLRDLPEILRAH